MQVLGIIQLLQSGWRFGLLQCSKWQKKRNVKFPRFSVYFLKSKSLSKKNAFLLPLINRILD